MHPHFTLWQLTLLVGTAVGIAALLVFIIYALHKAFRSSLRAEIARQSPRAADSSAFALATMQGVIANLKEEQHKLEESRRTAEQRATQNARVAETIASALEEALVVFDREGFIRLINPPARTVLGADTWSRRRYTEILGPDNPLAVLIQASLQSGEAVRRKKIELSSPSGQRRLLLATVLPLQIPAGNIEGAICLLREQPVTA
jgi:PAS domain-containing protein